MAPLDDAITFTPANKLECIEDLAKKILWLSTWTIHNANFIREKTDGLKVGGHQASCASSVAILSALYLSALKPEDRIAVKPHASPVFPCDPISASAIRASENLEKFRAFWRRAELSVPDQRCGRRGHLDRVGRDGAGHDDVFTSMVQDYHAPA